MFSPHWLDLGHLEVTDWQEHGVEWSVSVHLISLLSSKSWGSKLLEHLLVVSLELSVVVGIAIIELVQWKEASLLLSLWVVWIVGVPEEEKSLSHVALDVLKLLWSVRVSLSEQLAVVLLLQGVDGSGLGSSLGSQFTDSVLNDCSFEGFHVEEELEDHGEVLLWSLAEILIPQIEGWALVLDLLPLHLDVVLVHLGQPLDNLVPILWVLLVLWSLGLERVGNGGGEERIGDKVVDWVSHEADLLVADELWLGSENPDWVMALGDPSEVIL